MHISHDLIATKTCPSYEFLVGLVFGQVRVWDRKSAGLSQVGMVCGRVWVRSGRVQGGSRQGFSNWCGCRAGAEKKFQPVPDSIVHHEF